MADNRIQIDPRVHFGQPCVKGTRIAVSDVLDVVGAGIPFKKIVRDYYPDLTVEDVEACVEYAARVLRSEEVHAES
jgi:uncharacterized protein (DUF433 family)